MDEHSTEYVVSCDRNSASNLCSIISNHVYMFQRYSFHQLLPVMDPEMTVVIPHAVGKFWKKLILTCNKTAVSLCNI